MIRTTKTRAVLSMLAALMAFLAVAAMSHAQVKTETQTTAHAPSVTTTVARGEVVYVNGNYLVVKMEDGTMRSFPNVPESARVTVNGQQLGIHDVKPGMKLEKTITTTTTPKTITTVQTVTGKVWHVNAPTTVILTLEDGTNQQFKVPKGQQFMVNGQKTDVFGLRKGMQVSATKVVETPITEVSQKAALTGQLPPPPPPDQPILIAVAVPVPAPAQAPQAAPAAPALPKTATILPLIGLLGLLCLAGSLAVKTVRARL